MSFSPILSFYLDSIYFDYKFSYIMTTNIRGTDVSIFGILDGHGGEFAAVFAKDRLMELLSEKILAAIDVSVGKVRPLPHRRNSLIIPRAEDVAEFLKKKHTDSGGGGDGDEDDDKIEKAQSVDIPRTPSERRKKFTKTLSDDKDCDPANNTNCNKDHDSFLSKLSSIRITKESFMKKDKAIRPNQYEAGYYVDRNNKISFGKMITDLVLLTDYELIEKAKKQVSSLHILAVVNNSDKKIMTFLFLFLRKMSLVQHYYWPYSIRHSWW